MSCSSGHTGACCRPARRNCSSRDRAPVREPGECQAPRAQSQRHPEGHLRLGCLPSLGLSLIPQAVRDFRLQCPGVRWRSSTRHSDELLALVLSRDPDLALSSIRRRGPAAVADLGRAAVVYPGRRRARRRMARSAWRNWMTSTGSASATAIRSVA
ncbi:LysR substrate-binding domain-containing protein [Bradyrhizobium betae]